MQNDKRDDDAETPKVGKTAGAKPGESDPLSIVSIGATRERA